MTKDQAATLAHFRNSLESTLQDWTLFESKLTRAEVDCGVVEEFVQDHFILLHQSAAVFPRRLQLEIDDILKAYGISRKRVFRGGKHSYVYVRPVDLKGPELLISDGSRFHPLTEAQLADYEAEAIARTPLPNL